MDKATAETLIQFVRKLLADRHIFCAVFPPPFTSLAEHDMGLRRNILTLPDTAHPAQTEAGSIANQSIYHMEDRYACHYSIMQLPNGKYLLAGPWLAEPIDDADFYKIMERAKLPQCFWTQMQDYYRQLPKGQGEIVEVILNHLGASLYHGDASIYYIDAKQMSEWESYFGNYPLQTPKEPALSMHVLEKRYEAENRMLEAVSRGNAALALSIMESSISHSVPQRLPDKLADLKTYLIVGNTLMRKAVEKAGVHPWYIDYFSSINVIKIEQCANPKNVMELFPQIIRGYCKLVTERASHPYSQLVQKIIASVDANLKADLTLKAFASQLNVTGSYLSNHFKNETGTSLTAYVNMRRIEHAQFLLSATAMTIQSVAAEVGIPDIHYFTRLFKRNTGITPSAYRKQL